MTRHCGACTLCCKLTPVPEIGKPGGQRCRHQRMQRGCSIYPTRPLSCRAWSCRWLTGDDTADQRRPDFSHCVIDPMPDYVVARDDATGAGREIPVVQIWVDPRHPDAWQAREIMDFIERRGREGFGAIIRTNETDATVVFPPAVSEKLFGEAKWFRREGPAMREESHSQLDIAEVLTRITGEPYGVGPAQSLKNLFNEERTKA